jgi:hypothetical protein
MFEGKNLDLMILEWDDIDFLAECFNDMGFWANTVAPSLSRLRSLGC